MKLFGKSISKRIPRVQLQAFWKRKRILQNYFPGSNIFSSFNPSPFEKIIVWGTRPSYDEKQFPGFPTFNSHAFENKILPGKLFFLKGFPTFNSRPLEKKIDWVFWHQNIFSWFQTIFLAPASGPFEKILNLFPDTLYKTQCLDKQVLFCSCNFLLVATPHAA